MRKIRFANGEFYHIYNRGVDGRSIYRCDTDRWQFLSYFDRSEMLVDICDSIEIHAYCLMENHYHLLVRQVKERGVERIMHSLGTGYTKYFNTGEGRLGSLFKGSFEARHIETYPYLLHTFRYIHLNPLDYFNKAWRQHGIREIDDAFRYLEEYKWSSYLNTFSSDKSAFIYTSIIKDEFGSSLDYKTFLKDWICFGIPENFGFA